MLYYKGMNNDQNQQSATYKDPFDIGDSPVVMPKPDPIRLNKPQNQALTSDPKPIQDNVSLAQQSVTNQSIKSKTPINDLIKKLKTTKGIFTLLGILIICFGLIVLASLMNLDAGLSKITFAGHTLDKEGKTPIKNAQISINGQTATTNEQGEFSIPGLESKEYQVEVKATGYRSINEKVNISKFLFDFTSRKDYLLESTDKASVKGKVVSPSPLQDEKLKIGDITIPIKADGTFESSDVVVGSNELIFESVNFKDIKDTIEIKKGENEIAAITLEAAGDITGSLKSWVKEDLALKTKFYIENVLVEQVEQDKDGNFSIKDLDVDRTYKIRIEAEGYNTREYSYKIKKGINQFFDLRIVEKGIVSFYTGDSSNVSLSTSDYDGFNQAKINQLDTYKPTNALLIPNENLIYFQSDIDRTSGDFSTISLVYTFSITDKKVTKITQNTTKLGNLIPNFAAKKMLNITRAFNGGSNSYKLEIMDLTGNNRKKISEGNNLEFTNMVISDNGETVYYSESGNPKIYTSTGDVIQTLNINGIRNVYTISQDGSRMIINKRNSSTGLADLAMYDIKSKELRTLKENLDGFGYQFINNSNDKIVYIANREGKDNIYSLQLSNNTETKITNVPADYTIGSIFQLNSLLFYRTNNGLFVLDLTKPINLKLVTKNLSSN